MSKYFSFRCAIALVIMCFMLKPAYSELHVSGQNEARYARGSLPDSGSYNYFHNYLELTANVDKIRFYTRQSHLLPSEFNSLWQSGTETNDKRYLEYRSRYLKIRGGNFYRNWGRGLFFGTAEFIDLNFDNGLDGVLAEFEWNEFQTSVYRGVETDESGNIVEASEGSVVAYTFENGFKLGLSNSLLDSVSRHPELSRTGYEIEGEIGPASVYAVYTTDETKSNPKSHYNGFYSSISIYGLDWGVLVDYKNYHLLTYGGKLGQTPLQFAPTALPEITMYLLDHHPRQQHFGNDVGYQIEITKSIGDYTGRINLSQSSEKKGDEFLPSLSEEFSPYYGLYGNIEYDDYTNTRYVIQGGLHEDVEFTHTATGGFSNWFKRYGGGVIYERRLSGGYTIVTDLQFMIVDEVNRNRKYTDEFISVSLSKSPYLNSSLLIERSASRDETGGVTEPEWAVRGSNGRLWPGLETIISFLETNQLRLFIGHERGGLKCTGGICRWVNPFKGLKFTLTSQF